MRLLHFHEIAWIAGGAEHYLEDVTTELEAAGHTCGIVFGREPQKSSICKPEHRYYVTGISEWDPSGQSANDQTLCAIIASFRPDAILVHTFNNPNVLNFLMARFPCVRYVHGHEATCLTARMVRWTRLPCRRSFGFGCLLSASAGRCGRPAANRHLQNFYRLQSMKPVMSDFTALIVASHYMRSTLERHMLDARRVLVNPYFLPWQIPLQVPNTERVVPTVLYVGRITREKGPEELLWALHGLPRSPRVIFAGDGPARIRTESLASRLGMADVVQFLGWQDRGNLARLYTAADVVVVPSLWPEPFGIVGLEAMAYARPVVAFDVGGIREWLTDSVTGYLAAPGDLAGFAARLESLLLRPQQRMTMGRAGRERLDRLYRPENHVPSLLSVLTV